MDKLLSEQRPNDGGYHVKELVNEANERLKQIGRQGKRATIVAKKGSLSLQFTFNDGDARSQKNVGVGAIQTSAKGILEAEKIAEMVTHQLVAGTFTWDWYNKLIGKDTSEKTQVLTCKEMVEQFKKHFFKQREGNKAPGKSWYDSCAKLEKVLGNLDKPLSRTLIREVVESANNNSLVRGKTISGLVEFLKYFNNTDYKEEIKGYKARNNPKPEKRNVPNDKKIIEVHQTKFIPNLRCPKKWLYRYPQWQFLYGLLATYGLRIHEAWNIANWDKPVTLKNGDWVKVDIDVENSIDTERDAGDMVIPAILDPNNKEHILCIKHDTKTGYRMAFPLSPEGHNWIQEFDLLQPFNIPDFKDPLKRNDNGTGGLRCSNRTGEWFLKHKYGFTPHDLRHSYNHRGHLLGYNPKVLADSLGHSMQMNGNNYLRHMSDSVKLEGMIEAISKDIKTRSRVEILEAEIEALKAKVQAQENEIELLRTKLQLNETYRESKGQK